MMHGTVNIKYIGNIITVIYRPYFQK